MERLFPGIGAESLDQATLSVSKGGLGWRRAVDVAVPANLAALVAAAPRIQRMARSLSRAGLVPAGIIEEHLSSTTREAEQHYLRSLHQAERERATAYIQAAKTAATKTAGPPWLATASPRALCFRRRA